jgi:hypothetical protein
VGGNSVSTISGAGGFGQFALGTFVADALPQVISITSPGPYGPQLNLIQVRAIAAIVPEPSTLMLITLGGGLLVRILRRRK